MSNAVQPHRQQPTRSHCPWDSPGKNTGVGCHFLLQCMKVKSESEDTQSYMTLSNPMNCSLPSSSIHGIFQARVLEGVAIAFSKFIIYGNLKRICILPLYENCINLNYVELVHGVFQVYYILLFYIFSLLIFESLILKHQLKILIYLLKNNCNI